VIRRALILATLFLSSSAFAAWNPSFSSTREQMIVGETRTITLSASRSGFNTYDEFDPWTCVSDDKKVAIVKGELIHERRTAEVTITAVSPGTASILLIEHGRHFGPFVKIIVLPKPVRVTIASSAMTSIVGRPVTLVAIGEPAPLTFTWYRGSLGDTTQPLPVLGEELTFTPTTPGRYSFWVEAVALHGVSSAEISIDVLLPPRRHAVGRR
jgi:hypothetical protein